MVLRIDFSTISKKEKRAFSLGVIPTREIVEHLGIN